MTLSGNERWLVVGGKGLIGTELCDELRSVGIVANSFSRRTFKNDDYHITGDVTDPDWLEKIDRNGYDVVAYLAFSDSESFAKSQKINVDQVLKMADYFNGSNLKSFVYLGSMAVFGQVPEYGIVNESSRKNPVGTYAINKTLATQMLIDLNYSFTVNVIHPTNVYSKDAKSIKQYVEILRVNKITCGNRKTGIRNVVHANDVARSIIAVTKRTDKSNNEFIVNGQSITYEKFFDLLAYKRAGIHVPLCLASLTRGPIRRCLNELGFITPLKPPRYKRKIMTASSVFSSRKLNEMTGWHSRKVFEKEVSP
jgi:nucleoside-diphosphate-sugar epimerase